MSAPNPRAPLLEALGRSPSGLAWCAEHAALVDQSLAAAYGSARSEWPELAEVGVMATGGYGRRELAPWSDVDVAVAVGEGAAIQAEVALKALFRGLVAAVEAFGLRIGYAMLSEADATALDPETATQLLDARPVCGDEARCRAVCEAALACLPVPQYVLAKLSERAAAWAKTHDTPYAVRPDLKEGAGGIRSFQTAQWIRAALRQPPLPATAEYDFVLQVRNVLHLRAGRQVDRMDDARREEVAALLSMVPAELGSRLSRAMASLHLAYESTVEALPRARIELASGVVAEGGGLQIEPSARLSDVAGALALAVGLGVGIPRDVRVEGGDVDGGTVMRALRGGEPVVRAWDRSGLLDSLLPELAACRTLHPGDPSHEFTVFEHTLRAARLLSIPAPSPFIEFVGTAVPDISPLLLATLLHDVGKAEQGRPHSEAGADAARRVGERWGLFPETVDLVEWLVAEHLTMAQVLRTRDVALPDTVHGFAQTVATPERLACLTLLTWADVSSVHEGAWTPVQDSLARDLYARTLDVLRGDERTPPTPTAARERLADRASRRGAGESDVLQFLEAMPAQYVVTASLEQARHDCSLAAQAAAAGTVTVEATPHHEVQVSTLLVVAPDAPGHLSKILGVFYAHDLSLVSLRAATTVGPEPVLVDRFTVSYGGRVLPPVTVARVSSSIEDVLCGRVAIEDLLRARGHDPERTEPIDSYRFFAGDPGLLEVRASRGRGMPYRLSRLIASHGWNTVGARVGQWAGRGTASFYLQHADGSALDGPSVASALDRAGVSSAPR